jgi:hypothetical protein
LVSVLVGPPLSAALSICSLELKPASNVMAPLPAAPALASWSTPVSSTMPPVKVLGEIPPRISVPAPVISSLPACAPLAITDVMVTVSPLSKLKSGSPTKVMAWVSVTLCVR